MNKQEEIEQVGTAERIKKRKNKKKQKGKIKRNRKGKWKKRTGGWKRKEGINRNNGNECKWTSGRNKEQDEWIEKKGKNKGKKQILYKQTEEKKQPE